MARRPAAGWGHTPGWAQAFPGWIPLDDPGPLPLRAANSLRRWWWPTAAIVGFLAVVGFVLGHDPRPGLSNRSWLTITLAAVVVLLLTIHRAGRDRPPRAPLARAIGEYAVVALLAVLLATASGQPEPAERVRDVAGTRQSTERPAQRQPAEHDRRPPAERADAGTDRRPGIVRVVTGVWGWLARQWHTASEQADHSVPPPSTTIPKEGT